MDLEIDGNAALVLASSSGLGKASARALASEGANVMLNGRSEDRLSRAKAELQDVGGGRIEAHSADLTDREEIRGLVEKTVSEFGTIDHLVTNNGGPPSGPFLSFDDAEWQEAYELIFMNVVRAIGDSASYLSAGDGGTIVNIGSISMKEASDNLVFSNSIRMGIAGLSKTLANELAPEIRVNTVLPGVHQTPRIREVIEQGVDQGEFDSYEDGIDHWTDDIPVNAMGDPTHFGNVVAFLSAEASQFVNGASIVVDGGATASNL